MKIHELSKLTGTNIETIRFYRQKGFLNPKKLANGYYEYSQSDLINLMYVKKLRSFSIGNEDIKNNYFTGKVSSQLNNLEEEAQSLQLQINDLQEQLRYITFEKQHIIDSEKILINEVVCEQSIDKKIDIYDADEEILAIGANAKSTIFRMSTPSIFITKDYLNGIKKDELIPIKIGVGTYEHILKQNDIAIPRNSVIVPNGLCLSHVIRLEDTQQISLSQIKPLIDYAKKHKYQFISDTTGYLIRVEKHHNHYIYVFRIRACIQQNNIKNF